MGGYPEYAWIQDSVNDAIAESEEVRSLIKEIGRKANKFYYVFPENLRKNPMGSIFIELESGNFLSVLECRLSEN